MTHRWDDEGEICTHCGLERVGRKKWRGEWLFRIRNLGPNSWFASRTLPPCPVLIRDAVAARKLHDGAA
jgi:hypothetical protein